MARHLGAAGRIEEGRDKAVTTRFSSTAAFMIDSTDRSQPGATVTNSGNFTIASNQSIFNGFFNRLALQEIVLDWSIPNIAEHTLGDKPTGGLVIDLVNFTFTYQVPPAAATQYTVTLPQGFYTTQLCLDELVDLMNTAVGTPGAFVVGGVPGRIVLEVDQAVVPGGIFQVNDIDGENLAISIFGQRQLDRPLAASLPIVAPDIRVVRYLDFVSRELTYNQELKDNTTSTNSQRDVLYRWYMADDNVPQTYDDYGFPIYQGYAPFIKRRIIPYPKQILWNPTQPIGNITFQVYPDDYDEVVNPTLYPVADGDPEMEFQMTMLLSEN